MCQKIPVLCYDAALCRRLKQKLYDDLGSGAFDAERVQCMADTFDFIAKQMDAFGQDVIITHADLSLSNILITENGLVPIDFSLFGYCHPMMDLAMLYCSINGLENRRAIAAGYKKAGGRSALKCSMPVLRLIFCFPSFCIAPAGRGRSGLLPALSAGVRKCFCRLPGGRRCLQMIFI